MDPSRVSELIQARAFSGTERNVGFSLGLWHPAQGAGRDREISVFCGSTVPALLNNVIVGFSDTSLSKDAARVLVLAVAESFSPDWVVLEPRENFLRSPLPASEPVLGVVTFVAEGWAPGVPLLSRPSGPLRRALHGFVLG